MIIVAWFKVTVTRVTNEMIIVAWFKVTLTRVTNEMIIIAWYKVTLTHINCDIFLFVAWFKGTQAMMTIGMILSLVALILGLIYTCIHFISKNLTLIIFMALSFASCKFELKNSSPLAEGVPVCMRCTLSYSSYY